MIQLLQSKKSFSNFLSQLKIDQPNPYFANQLTSCVTQFAVANESALEAYFIHQQLSLTEINRQFVHSIYENGQNKELTLTETLDSLGTTFEMVTDFSFKNILTKRFSLEQEPRDEIHLLSFGSGAGFYEQSLKRFLIQSGIAKTVHLYGYDPYATPQVDITMLTAEELTTMKDRDNNDDTLPLQFDFVLARWSLHHVALSERWTLFESALDCLSPTGTSIVIEHGYRADSDQWELQESSDMEALYLLLNTWIDSVANIGIVPEWFERNPENYGEDFFVQYLTDKDVKEMQSHCHRHQPLSFTRHRTGPCFPWNDILVLQPEPERNLQQERRWSARVSMLDRRKEGSLLKA